MAETDLKEGTVLNPTAQPISLDIPYDNSDRLESTRAWLTNNPDVSRPYRRLPSERGHIWVDQHGDSVNRDVERERSEISNYLNYLKVNDPAHYDLLQFLKTEVAPMNSRTRIAVNIPAWMEGKIIYRTLEHYSKQVDKRDNELDPDLYEINVIVNRKAGEATDNSVEEIERLLSVYQGK